jgi:quercetin dioxygenase-like cupin family protein
VVTVEFELDGQRFVGINGGPQFTFDEAVSFQIDCETQDAQRGRRRSGDLTGRDRAAPRYAARMAGGGGVATQVTPGDGERLWFLGTLATVKVPGEAVEGRFALIEFLFPRHASPPLHTHPQDESYFVLDGRLTVQAGEERFEIGEGGTAVVPMGMAHTFRVDSDTARVLVLSTPAGIERFVRDGGVPASAPTLPPADAPRPSPDEMERIFRAHGQVNVGPPLEP